MRAKQASFRFRTWGGKRKGSGRKPKIPGRPQVAHTKRPSLTGQAPVHVTVHLASDVPNLRRNALHGLLIATIREGQKDGFRICQFAILGNHIHLIVEADSTRDLARGMQGLNRRLARRVNQALGRTGRFFSDRYHAHVLRTPLEVHRALAYVLLNHRRHEAERSSYRPPPAVDGFSSGAWFAGWTITPPNAARIRGALAPPIVAPRSWLLRIGWRKHGTIALP
jgi:REP element-mobilizing transposase RayT